MLDVVRHEGGWFERFLTDGTPLLPDDEALLARAWTLVDRTVYEVLQVRAEDQLTVRDRRTGDHIDVRDRTFSKTAAPGMLICARAVPDGAGHQFVGGIFTVTPGSERDVLRLLDEHDGLALLAYVAELQRRPTG